MWTPGYFGPAKKSDLLLFWRECRGREPFLPNLLFFGFGFASHGKNKLWYFWMLNNERSRALLFWTSKWKLLKNWAKSFFFPQRRTLKYTLGKKKTFENWEENNKMSGYAQLCGSFFMHGSLFMLATRHVLPNLCQNDFKWEWLVCFVEAMQ